MRPGGAEADQHVARLEIVARQQGAALGGADGKAGQVVVARPVHARHLGRLAADQRRAGQPAALGDACDDALGDRRVERAAGEIIEKGTRARRLARRGR